MADDGQGGRKVGEVAEATGLTVRTLHHYEQIGLLVASGRTPSGHRLYSPTDIERLYRICLLRRLGLPLGEIGSALDDPAWDLRSALVSHRSELERRMAAEAQLRTHLVRMESSAGPSTEDLLTVLEEMTVLDTTIQKRIGTLVYEDLDAVHEFLVRAFGLGPGEVTRDGDGATVHVELEAGDGVLWLHPETEAFGLASPRRVGSATAGTSVMVADCDAHFARARDEGAEIVYEPVDQPYGYREYSARDPEGGFWSFMQPLG
ncbi:MAG TPA: MerR family transcriptional regulator [Iamia sp.]|nr:MerR family transcriptional regulator [Iamia sp.]